MGLLSRENKNHVGITEADILHALRVVKDPDLHKDIVSLNFIKNLKIDGSIVSFDINLTTPACPVKEKLKDEAHRAVMALDGITDVRINLTAEVRQHAGMDKSTLSSVRNIVAVGSGKGGVGKSTVATNLAVGLAQTGARVGLLDADIYGPTIPIMLGKVEQVGFEDDRIIPLENHGIKFVSMGLFVPGDKPLIWRGPMAHKALEQCLFQVVWGELDYLVVDMPPGTGDVHLTLVQSVPVTGGVIVSTPQDVGWKISLKTLRMFQQTNVAVLGIIENMSYYICPHCGAREYIFGSGGAANASEKLGVPFLGEIPLDTQIRIRADEGTPIVAADPDSPAAKAYTEILGNLAAQISIQNYTKIPLRVVEVPA
jgi:ATP-binding protein involved in chromosome partitioning